MELSIRSNQPKMTAFIIACAPFTFIFGAPDSKTRPRASVPYVNIRDILLSVFISFFFFFLTELWEKKQKTRGLYRLENTISSFSWATTTRVWGILFFSLIVVVHLFILYDVRERERQPCGNSEPKKCFSFFFPPGLIDKIILNHFLSGLEIGQKLRSQTVPGDLIIFR